jgi:hypothetical protein
MLPPTTTSCANTPPLHANTIAPLANNRRTMSLSPPAMTPQMVTHHACCHLRTS